MKKALSVGIIILLAIGASFIVYASNVSNTQHNILRSIDDASEETTEVCMFCHTPHKADMTVAPLWNHTNQPVTAYNIYGNPFGSIQGTGGQPAGISRACLSCHDGQVAVDSVQNPSPNSYNSANQDYFTISWITDVTGVLDPSTNALLGTDLADDHPISITYRSDLDPDLQINVGATVTGNWTGTNLPLFGAGPTYTVECASCHNVHDDTFNPFLRISNDGSFMCLTCHLK